MDQKLRHEKIVRERLKTDFLFYASNLLKIRTKETGIKPFILNSAQEYLHFLLEEHLERTGKIRAIILKGRQQGISTYVAARGFWDITHKVGARGYIMTHQNESTQLLFGMIKRFQALLPDFYKCSVSRDNTKTLYFDAIDSSYGVGTEKNKNIGRGDTIHFFHGSEFAFWVNAKEHLEGIFQAVPETKGTSIFLETTAASPNDVSKEFFEAAQRKEIDFIPIFIPWFYSKEYQIGVTEKLELTEYETDIMKAYKLSMEQLAWRRKKIAEFARVNEMKDGEISFKRSYPCSPEEAYQASSALSLIKSIDVLRARKNKQVVGFGPLLIGVDPATGVGKDRSSIIKRRGPKAYDLQSYKNATLMELAGIITSMIESEKPAMVLIDSTGVGAGLVSRLQEIWGDTLIKGINSASNSVMYPDKYVNMRSQMWGEMKKWIEGDSLDVSIPDSDSLHSEICSVSILDQDSNSRLKLKKKAELIISGARSPDQADALALTFSVPVYKQLSSQKSVISNLGIVFKRK